MKKTFLKASALLMVCSCLIGSNVHAAEYVAVGGSSGSYTLAVGPGPKATYKYNITGNSGGSFAMQVKDPFRWKDKDTGSFSYRASGGHTYTDGSKKAYWRGRIVNGNIKVTV